MSKPIIALMYDFDKTLCSKDMQEYSFIPSIGMSASDFWSEADRIAHKSDMDKILAYMYLMIKQAKKNDVSISRESFIEVEHYIISSGLKEIIDGTSIAKEFKRIYACEFHYNASGNADWPQRAVNYTTKTQYLFRISKGVLDVMDDVKLNRNIEDDDRRIPYRNMIYIGDGLTDVPCMKLIKQYGGQSIAIYQKSQKSKTEVLLKDNRVNFICEADYSKDSELDRIIKLIVEKMATTSILAQISHEQREFMKDKE